MREKTLITTLPASSVNLNYTQGKQIFYPTVQIYGKTIATNEVSQQLEVVVYNAKVETAILRNTRRKITKGQILDKVLTLSKSIDQSKVTFKSKRKMTKFVDAEDTSENRVQSRLSYYILNSSSDVTFTVSAYLRVGAEDFLLRAFDVAVSSYVVEPNFAQSTSKIQAFATQGRELSLSELAQPSADQSDPIDLTFKIKAIYDGEELKQQSQSSVQIPKICDSSTIHTIWPSGEETQRAVKDLTAQVLWHSSSLSKDFLVGQQVFEVQYFEVQQKAPFVFIEDSQLNRGNIRYSSLANTQCDVQKIQSNLILYGDQEAFQKVSSIQITKSLIWKSLHNVYANASSYADADKLQCMQIIQSNDLRRQYPLDLYFFKRPSLTAKQSKIFRFDEQPIDFDLVKKWITGSANRNGLQNQFIFTSLGQSMHNLRCIARSIEDQTARQQIFNQTLEIVDATLAIPQIAFYPNGKTHKFKVRTNLQNYSVEVQAKHDNSIRSISTTQSSDGFSIVINSSTVQPLATTSIDLKIKIYVKHTDDSLELVKTTAVEATIYGLYADLGQQYAVLGSGQDLNVRWSQLAEFSRQSRADFVIDPVYGSKRTPISVAGDGDFAVVDSSFGDQSLFEFDQLASQIVNKIDTPDLLSQYLQRSRNGKKFQISFKEKRTGQIVTFQFKMEEPVILPSGKSITVKVNGQKIRDIASFEELDEVQLSLQAGRTTKIAFDTALTTKIHYYAAEWPYQTSISKSLTAQKFTDSLILDCLQPEPTGSWIDMDFGTLRDGMLVLAYRGFARYQSTMTLIPQEVPSKSLVLLDRMPTRRASIDIAPLELPPFVLDSIQTVYSSPTHKLYGAVGLPSDLDVDVIIQPERSLLRPGTTKLNTDLTDMRNIQFIDNSIRLSKDIVSSLPRRLYFDTQIEGVKAIVDIVICEDI